VSDFAERAYAVIRRVPAGRVVSYGGVAAVMGHPRAARGVGRALCTLPEASTGPWWRVVNARGEVAITCAHHSAALQRELLRREGVAFDDRGRVDWRRHGWQHGDD
jgi:methylated-DNA-protein-cysteine methyltransferase related protein